MDAVEIGLYTRLVGGFDGMAAVHEKVRVVAEGAVADVPSHVGQAAAFAHVFRCGPVCGLHRNFLTVCRLVFCHGQPDQQGGENDDADQKNDQNYAENAPPERLCRFFFRIGMHNNSLP